MAATAIIKTFSHVEFADLLTRASTHLIERCRAEYCDPPPPWEFSFVLDPTSSPTPSPPKGLLDAIAVARYLVGSDGSFPDWVNVTPIGVAAGRTVLELVYAERHTTRLLVGPVAFPFEPLHLLGPTLPPEWQEGDPLPKIALPRVNLPPPAGLACESNADCGNQNRVKGVCQEACGDGSAPLPSNP